jgi:hypothetical protein
LGWIDRHLQLLVYLRQLLVMHKHTVVARSLHGCCSWDPSAHTKIV